MCPGRRPWLLAGLAGLMAVTLALPSDARSVPLRSGTIVSGVLTTSPAWECGLVPDCAAWLASGCHPALSGRDPAWLASIVDVASIAGRRKPRSFAFSGGEPVGQPLGGVVVQFWRADCSEVAATGWRSYDSDTDDFRRAGRFRIPAAARWMTVTGNDNVNIRWTLT